jgi:hypothetical protein
MIYIIKDFIYYKNLLSSTVDKLHISNKNQFSFYDLNNLIENNIYKNIFFDWENYLTILNHKLCKNINIYIYIQNISLIKTHELIGTKIVMENYSKEYYSEIIEFFKNKNHIINIPHEIQLTVIRNFIIDLTKNIKNKDILKDFIWNIYNIFFYKDIKNLLQYLFILNEKINFLNYVLKNDI